MIILARIYYEFCERQWDEHNGLTLGEIAENFELDTILTGLVTVKLVEIEVVKEIFLQDPSSPDYIENCLYAIQNIIRSEIYQLLISKYDTQELHKLLCQTQISKQNKSSKFQLGESSEDHKYRIRNLNGWSDFTTNYMSVNNFLENGFH